MTDETARLAQPRPGNAIDAEFTLDTIADLDAIFSRRAEAARAALVRFAVTRDIAYGPEPGETLNLFHASAPHAPVNIFIHGGFWSSLDADLFSFLAGGFTPFGAALIVIDYPMIPAVRMADIVESCQRAVAWTWRHGAENGIDPDRIFISGNSAGGHLVAELMDRAWLREGHLPPDVIKGGTAVSGLYDLAPVAASYRNALLRFTDDEVAQFSPLHRDIDIAAPVIVAVGANETGEFLRQSAAFAARCRAQGAEVEHMVLPGANHITIVLDSLADPDALLNRAVRRQMGLDGVATPVESKT